MHAAARLDRLPLSAFHWRLLFLIGAGVFLDSFDIYVGGSVTGVLLREGWSTLSLNATFVTVTFLGLMIGAFVAGDHRRPLRQPVFLPGQSRHLRPRLGRRGLRA